VAADVREPGMFSALVWERVATLVVRGDDGVLRAFSDTCRHRDPLIVAERAGPGMRATAAFTCPFAGWPGPHGTTGPVRPLPVAELHGVVLVRPAGAAPIVPTDAFAPGDAADLDALGLGRARCVAETRAVVTADRHEVLSDLASRPGASTIAGHAVVTTGPDDGALELTRVFGLDDETSERRCVVDRRTYRLRA
jgi:hypothetical protein